jgi:hypothetical protein
MGAFFLSSRRSFSRDKGEEREGREQKREREREIDGPVVKSISVIGITLI